MNNNLASATSNMKCCFYVPLRPALRVTVAARSSPARTLGSWFRIPLEERMSVCVYSVFAFLCALEAASWRYDRPSTQSYRVFIGLRNGKSGQGPEGCRDIKRQKKCRQLSHQAKVSEYFSTRVELQIF
jgi:hypothetical protein